jgi:hypothetical protein
MKKIFVIVLILFLFSNKTYAQKIDIFTSGTLKSPHGAIINSIANSTEKYGLNFEAKQAGSCAEAVKIFDESTKPIGLLWSTRMIKFTRETKQNCIPTFEKTIPMAVTFQSFDVCVLKDFEFQNNKEYTLGNSKWNPYKSQLQYMNSNNRNITFKNVNYEGSANVVAALVNKEINVGIVLLQSAASSIEAGTIKCLYSTGSKKYGQQLLHNFAGKSPIAELQLGTMFFVRNMNSKQIEILKKSLEEDFVKEMEKMESINTKVGINKEEFTHYIEYAEQDQFD